MDEIKYFGDSDYITIRAPEEFPGYKYDGKYCYEHHYIYWKNTGHVVEKDKEEIHHIDGNKKNNDFKNLELKSKSDHFKHHHNKKVKYVRIKCPGCGKVFERPFKRSHLYSRCKSTVTTCSKPCNQNQYKKYTKKEIEDSILKIYERDKYQV